MAKIPFDIKYRPQIESGEYKVETNFGSPVEIVCWNRRDDTANKTAGTVEEIASWNINGKLCDAAFPQNPVYDLFIITPEPELTEWERTLSGCIQKHGMLDCGAADKIAKESAAELLDLARKESEEELKEKVLHDYWKQASDQCAQARKDAKAEALNDLPRWRKCGFPMGTDNPFPRYLVRTGGGHYSLTSTILKCDEYILLSELAKLPKFNED